MANLEVAETAVDIAREAGRLLMRELPLGRFRGAIEHKEGRELVSRVDRAAEALIADRVGEAFPGHAILGEEGGLAGGDGEAEHTWIVDPLDGTTNFLHGHPMFAVSIALARFVPSFELLAAVVHLPYLSETYFAGAGEGAFLNTSSLRLAVSDANELADALVATGFAYDRERFPNYDNFVRVADRSRGIRRCGAASVDLAYVAAGRYDAFWELGLRPWDVAAGALLVREAGGVVSDGRGGDDWLQGASIIAANAHAPARSAPGVITAKSSIGSRPRRARSPSALIATSSPRRARVEAVMTTG
jgi:myo-inositol-1(or 4)-monophosphatase